MGMPPIISLLALLSGCGGNDNKVLNEQAINNPNIKAKCKILNQELQTQMNNDYHNFSSCGFYINGSITTEYLRLEALKGLISRENIFSIISFYPHYKEMINEGGYIDPVEYFLIEVADNRMQHRLANAIGISRFTDIKEYFEKISSNRPELNNSIGLMYLMGHGTTQYFKFGGESVSAEALANYESGYLSDYLANGASVCLEGCSIGINKNYLKEIGRIFFGNNKRGFIKGNTKDVVTTIGTSYGDDLNVPENYSRTLYWPRDF